jgi:hypothetical protein
LNDKVSEKISVSNEININLNVLKVATEDQQDKTDSTLQSRLRLQRQFKDLEQRVEKYEKLVGAWNPSNKFMTLFHVLDELCDQVDILDQRTVEQIGHRAKELNRELEQIIRYIN